VSRGGSLGNERIICIVDSTNLRAFWYVTNKILRMIFSLGILLSEEQRI